MTKRQTSILAVFLLGLVGIIVVFLVAGGSGTKVIPVATSDPVAAERLFSEVSLQGTDLPSGWRLDFTQPVTKYQVPGKIFYYYNTSARELLWVNISQELLAYPTAEVAKQTYDNRATLDFKANTPDFWKEVPELNFLGHADQLKTACTSVSIDETPVLTCKVLARYQNLIVDVMADVLQDKWLTIPQFKSVLQATDQRIVKVLGEQK
jgi:hypothetical protein